MNSAIHRRFFAVLGAFLALASPALAQWQADGTPVCSASGDQFGPVVVADGSGGAFVVWEDHRGADPQVYAQHFNFAGEAQWAPNGQLVSSGSYPQYGPVAVGDGSGGLYVVWILSIVPGAYTGQGQRLSGAGAPYWAVGGAPVLPGAAFPTKLAIAGDGRLPDVEPPGAIVAFTDIRGGVTTDIYIHAFSSTGAARWTSPVCTAAGNQTGAQIVSDGSGSTLSNPKGAIVAWRDYRADVSDADIYAQRIRYDGVAMLGADGLGIATGAGTVQEPRLVRSFPQNGIVAWPGPAPGRTFATFADRVGTAGSWGSAVPTTDPYGGHSNPGVVSDQGGGVIAAWSVGLARELYASRIDYFGARQWGDAGKLVCVSGGGKFDPKMVTGVSPTTVVAWHDSRKGGLDRDLYAQLLDGNGDRVWADDGVPVRTGSGGALDFAMTTEPSGGAIIAWVDTRNGNQDIYISRVTGAGGVVSSPVSPRPSLALSAPFPNPAREELSLNLDLPDAAGVTATVHDVSGRTVRMLLSGFSLPAGRHRLAWDGLDASGAHMPAGIYWIRAQTRSATATRRAVVVR